VSAFASKGWQSRDVCRHRTKDSELMPERNMRMRRPKLRTKSARVTAVSKSEKGPVEEQLNAGRREEILTEAARLFATRGFHATTIRDIAAAVRILGGSIYYHFPSKEDIFLAVHSKGVETISSAVRAATNGISDPWDRLEAAAMAHCEALLSTSDLPVLISPHFAYSVGNLREKLTAQRDEKLITKIIADLDLPRTIDRHAFRLHFLGALNWTTTWYRPDGRFTPAEIGRQLTSMLRCRAKG
jgi:AcrR family transcriptional regulator